MGMIKIFLKSGKDVPVRRFHPWIFSGAVARVEGRPEDGDMVEVYDRSGELLGVGHFHHGSIAVRLLNFGPANIGDSGFWEDKLRNALAVRALFTDITAADGTYRLVHGEGDGLSGLIVDIYGDTAVVQCHSIGIHRQVDLIAGALETVYEGRLRAVYDKSYESLPVRYAETQSNGYRRIADGYDTAAHHVVNENGVRFRVDWQTGQKTGFFLDQRDNRQLLSRFAPGKSVLNAFCYTGGFSCYALKAGARLVHSVDISQRAMELCAENVALNEPFQGTHEGYTEDVLRFLKQHVRSYEVAVIDPPAYAKSLDKRHNAVQGYKRLNVEAIRSVAPGGVLFTFSCSQVVDRELFYHTIAAAAMEVGRPVRVLHHLSQGADHPVSLFHPEGSYLKGLVLKLD
jgi:23S rRNA (cytosine1962-C5)-methyltransferase